MNLERSWVDGEMDISNQKPGEVAAEPNSGRFKQSSIRQFKTELTLPMHDGQTAETTQAADPGTKGFDAQRNDKRREVKRASP